MHQRNLEDGQQGDDRAAPGALVLTAAKPAYGEVTEVGDEQEGGGRDPRVPHPIHAPRDPAPQAAGQQGDPHEQHPDLGTGSGETIPRQRSSSLGQVGGAADGRDDERQICQPRTGHVDVEDSYTLALDRVVG